MSYGLRGSSAKARYVRRAASIVACSAMVALSLSVAAQSAHAQSTPTLAALSAPSVATTTSTPGSANCTGSGGVYSCSSPTVTLFGTGAIPGDDVVVASNGYGLGETAIASDGSWILPVTLLDTSTNFTGTTYNLDAFQINSALSAYGNASSTVSVTVVGNQLLTNGSFERPSVTSLGLDSNWAYFFTQDQVNAGVAVQPYSTTPVTGWASTNSNCGIELQTASTIPVQPKDGAQYAELASNCVSGVTQTLSTVPGTQYTLSFYFQARPTTGQVDNSTENSMSVQWGGQTVAPTLVGTGSWQLSTYVLTATGTSTALYIQRHQPSQLRHLRRLPRRRVGGPHRLACPDQHLVEHRPGHLWIWTVESKHRLLG